MEFQVTRSDLFSDDESLSSLLPKGSFVPLSFHQFDADVIVYILYYISINTSDTNTM